MKLVSSWFIVLFLMSTQGFSQTTTIADEKRAEPISWMTWNEAMEAQEMEPKMILVYIYTDWCVLCRRMENGPFLDSNLVELINDNFYAVNLDAESRETWAYQQEEYSYVREGNLGYHQLAAKLLDGRLSFPSLVFLDQDLTIIQSVPGYKEGQELERVLVYFGLDYYLKTPWSTFERTYQTQKFSD